MKHGLSSLHLLKLIGEFPMMSKVTMRGVSDHVFSSYSEFTYICILVFRHGSRHCIVWDV